jgi:membrane-bound ClpP family serine protease
VALAIAGTITAFLVLAVAKVVQIRRKPAEVGVHSLVGATGIVRRGGLVSVKGELWQARAAGGEHLAAGDEVTVEEVEGGLVLVVRPARTKEPQPA